MKVVFGLGVLGVCVVVLGCGEDPTVSEAERAALVEEIREQVKAELAAEAPPQNTATPAAPAASAPAGNAPSNGNPFDTGPSATLPAEQTRRPAQTNPFDTGSTSPGDTRRPATSSANNPFDTGGPARNPPAERQASAAAQTPTVFRMHEVTDPGMNNQVAVKLLVPEGWKIEGGMTRISPQYFNIPFVFDLKATAPDGRQARFMPSLSFGFDTQQPGQTFAPTGDGNMVMPLPESPGQWIMEMNRLQPDPTISNLRLVSEEMIPDLTEQLRRQSAFIYQSVEQNRQQQDQFQQLGGGGFRFDIGFDTQATKIVLRYTQNGIDLEETVLMTWGAYVNVMNGQLVGGHWYVGLMRSARGPVGTDYLNDPELMAIFKSARNDPVWQAEMNKHYAAMARIGRDGAADRNAQWRIDNAKIQQINNETSDIIANGYKSREAIRDAGFAKQIDAIHEVTPYTTPGGETVKLPSFYDNVYTDNNNRFILTNDHFYNPGSDLNMTGSWTKIESQQ